MEDDRPLRPFTTLEKYINALSSDASSYPLVGVTKGFMDFIHETRIVQNSSQTPVPPLGDYANYIDLIDGIISYLHQERIRKIHQTVVKNAASKVDNIVVNGYVDPSTTDWTSSIAHPAGSFAANNLKGTNWKLLYNLIGKEQFLFLLWNFKAYVKLSNGTYVQVFGEKWRSDRQQIERITKRMMLYRTRANHRNTRIVSGSAEEVLNVIYSNEINLKSIPKRYRKLLKLLKKIIQTDEKLRYIHIYENMVPQVLESESNVLKSVTPESIVIQFVLVIFGKLFTSETWGSPANKSQIVNTIVRFIQHDASEYLNTEDILKSIKLTDIPWLGKTSKVTSLHDWASREAMFSSFMKWIFSNVVSRIVSSFWYVTEASSIEDSTLLYIPHYKWNAITKSWFQKYEVAFLEKVEEGDPSYRKGVEQKFNYGKLRLVPKSNDFRLICVPSSKRFGVSQATDSKEKDAESRYQDRYKSELRMVRKVLSNQTRRMEDKTLNKCYSSRDVASQIAVFKKHLLLQYGRVPKLYFIKFDMKQCYDSLNRTKIVQCIEKLFSGIEDDEEFYIKQYTETSIPSSKIKNVRTSIKLGSKVHELDLKYLPRLKDNTAIVDLGKIDRISKRQVIELCKTQIYDPLLLVEGAERRYFKRRRGVLQGLPLSGIFCDLVYDEMLKDQFDFLIKESDSLIVKLVDDFLVITVSPQDCQQVLDILKNGALNSYGAIPNTEKTAIVDPDNETKQLTFVGLSICTNTLEITRKYPKVSYSSIKTKHSFASAYKYLNWCYEMRLAHFLLDLDLESSETVRYNVSNLVSSVLFAFKSNFKLLSKRDLNYSHYGFKLFLIELLSSTIFKFVKVNNSDEGIDGIIQEFSKSVRDVFEGVVRFTEIVQWINTF